MTTTTPTRTAGRHPSSPGGRRLLWWHVVSGIVVVALLAFSVLLLIADETDEVDFGDLPSVISNASTSAGSAVLLSELDATVFQFSTVQSAEYRIEGSCTAFTEWLQTGGCEPRAR